MKRFHIIKKASPVNYALESSRTLDNGVVLKLIHCGETLTVSASYEKHLESFADLRSVEEAAYIEDYLTRKYSGVDAADPAHADGVRVVRAAVFWYTGREREVPPADGRAGHFFCCRTAVCGGGHSVCVFSSRRTSRNCGGCW